MDIFMVLFRVVLEIVFLVFGVMFLISWLGVWTSIPFLLIYGIVIWYTEQLGEDLS